MTRQPDNVLASDSETGSRRLTSTSEGPSQVRALELLLQEVTATERLSIGKTILIGILDGRAVLTSTSGLVAGGDVGEHLPIGSVDVLMRSIGIFVDLAALTLVSGEHCGRLSIGFTDVLLGCNIVGLAALNSISGEHPAYFSVAAVSIGRWEREERGNADFELDK